MHVQLHYVKLGVDVRVGRYLSDTDHFVNFKKTELVRYVAANGYT